MSGIVGSIVWGFYFAFVRSSSFWFGIVAGFVFGLAIATIAKFRQVKVSESPPVLTNESILREGAATHDGLAGQLYLTSRRVLFEGYPTDDTSPEVSTLFDGRDVGGPAHEVSIPILRIADAKGKTFGIDSRLEIVLNSGEAKYFGTEDLTEWLDDIATARQKFLDEPRSEDLKLFP